MVGEFHHRHPFKRGILENATSPDKDFEPLRRKGLWMEFFSSHWKGADWRFSAGAVTPPAPVLDGNRVRTPVTLHGHSMLANQDLQPISGALNGLLRLTSPRVWPPPAPRVPRSP